jgi:hypothetical protein
MNYSTQTLNFQLGIEKEFNEILMEQMHRESLYMRATLESMVVITEAVSPDSAEKKIGIFTRIKEFIKRIFNLFTEKIKALTQSNKDWLESNKESFNKMNYSGLQLEIIPFWDVDFKAKINEVKNAIDRLMDKSGTSDMHRDYKDIEAVKKGPFKNYLDEDGDLANGAKNYFRVGKPDNKSVRPTSLAGDELKKRILNDFHPYCLNYATATFGEIKTLVDSVNKKLDFISNNLGEKQAAEPAKESFCVIENALFSETNLMFATNMVVLEAEQPAANADATQTKTETTTTAPANANDKPKVSATKVTLQNNADDKTTKMNNNVNSLSTDDTMILKNIAQCVQTIAAAALTVAEERYTAYITAMRQTLGARKSTVPTAPNEAKK